MLSIGRIEQSNDELFKVKRIQWSLIFIRGNVDSYQPARCTSEFVRKQLQNTIHGRQKPAGGKDMSGGAAAQKSMLNR
jgi:hypothetical protein